MKYGIVFGILVLAGMPCGAHAQSQGDSQALIMAPPEQKPTESPADPDYKPTTKFLDSSAKTSKLISTATKCATWIAKYNDINRYVGKLEEVEKTLGSFGKGLKYLSTLVKVGTGDTSGAISDIQDNIQNVVVTKAGCLAFGTFFCPFFKAGMTVGSLINYLPKLLYWDANEQTINEVVGDFYAPMWGDLVNSKTVEQVEAGIEKMRADARIARASAQYAYNSSQMCKKAEATKSAVADILAKAKANAAAAPMTPMDTGLTATTDAGISKGQAAAASANAAGNSQIMSSMQTLQQQAMQQQPTQQPAQPEIKLDLTYACANWAEHGYYPESCKK